MRTLARLDHPDLVRLHDAGTEHGRAHLVTDLVEGPTLASVASRTVAGRVDLLAGRPDSVHPRPALPACVGAGDVGPDGVGVDLFAWLSQ